MAYVFPLAASTTILAMWIESETDVTATHLGNATTWVFQFTAACETLDFMADAPQCDGKIYEPAKFGGISIEGTAKQHEMKLQKQRFQRREAEAARAVAEIEPARYARLPWPIRAIGAVLDFIFRRPSR
jgi:hypothetical protein